MTLTIQIEPNGKVQAVQKLKKKYPYQKIINHSYFLFPNN